MMASDASASSAGSIAELIVTALALILLSPLAHSGEHRPLCEKVAAADLVYEMRFTQVGRYPSTHRSKGWGPPEAELKKTAETGKLTHSFKGEAPIGSPWIPAYGIGFQVSSSVAKWDEFFAQKTFSKIFFLARRGEGYSTTGWAEETAGCGSSDHWSWCPGFTAFKAQVQACISKK